jgi:hypothetical protein
LVQSFEFLLDWIIVDAGPSVLLKSMNVFSLFLGGFLLLDLLTIVLYVIIFLPMALTLPRLLPYIWERESFLIPKEDEFGDMSNYAILGGWGCSIFLQTLRLLYGGLLDALVFPEWAKNIWFAPLGILPLSPVLFKYF